MVIQISNVALWLGLLNLLSLRQLQGCHMFECIYVHSHCSQLCTDGMWLDLKVAKATQYLNHAGNVAKVQASLAIDGKMNTCAMTKVCIYWIIIAVSNEYDHVCLPCGYYENVHKCA